jgi:hypothetical protein
VAHKEELLDAKASLPFDSKEELAAMADDVGAPLPEGDPYPHLTEVAGALLAAGYDPAAEFLHGLDLILDALERLRVRFTRRD